MRSFLLLNFYFYVVCVSRVDCETFEGVEEQQDYFMKYGYIQPKAASRLASSMVSGDVFMNAVKHFQRMAGLSVTGVVDEKTKEMMSKPRCGVSDTPQAISHRRKRYAVYGTKWKNTELKYKFTGYTDELKNDVVEKTIKKAFEYWQNVSGLTFKRSYSEAEIEVSFRVKNHGDDDPFDGIGGTLAHAFFPSNDKVGGDVHFDDDEHWTVNSYQGTNLLQVAVHELGHSLGLSHSDVHESIMAPFYNSYDPNMKLHDDDIQAIQSLYGSPDKGRDTASFRTTIKPSLAPICKIGTPDAIVPFKDILLVFKGNKMYAMDEIHNNKAKELTASNLFPKLPDNVDTAFHSKASASFFTSYDYVIFIKGKQVWKYRYYEKPFGFQLSHGYPKLISKEYEGIPDKLDAAFEWKLNGRTYFFAGKNYYRMSNKNQLDSGYPRPITNWNMMFETVDVVFNYPTTSPSEAYFISENQIYKYDQSEDKVTIGFPKPISWFFGCSPKGSFQESLESTMNFSSAFCPQSSFLLITFALLLVRFKKIF